MTILYIMFIRLCICMRNNRRIKFYTDISYDYFIYQCMKIQTFLRTVKQYVLLKFEKNRYQSV